MLRKQRCIEDQIHIYTDFDPIALTRDNLNDCYARFNLFICTASTSRG